MMDEDSYGLGDVPDTAMPTTSKSTDATPTSSAEVTPTSSAEATPTSSTKDMPTYSAEAKPTTSLHYPEAPPTLSIITETTPPFNQHDSSAGTSPTPIQTEALPIPIFGNHKKRDSSDENSLPTHFLVCSDRVDGLMQPMRASTRVKYVCMAICRSLIAMGTNTGVVYVFSRESLRRVHVIPMETEGSIVQIALNHHGQLVAYGTSKGHVLVSDLYPASGGKPKRVRCASEHVGSRVLVLKWNETGERLYIGDDLGRVSVVNFLSLSQTARNSVGALSSVILRLNSPVIQIDTDGDKLLVSTQTKTILCDHIKHQYSQIGKRPRDGRFGSCFSWRRVERQTSLIYCSRPGSRMWVVDHEGTVLNTHQFKQLLDVPPTPIFSLNFWRPDDFASLPTPGPQSVAFLKLLPCGERYLLTFTARGVYILDPEEVKLVLWNHQITDVEDVCCHDNEIYFLKTSGDIQHLELLTVHDLWTCLLSRQEWEAAGWLLVTHGVLIDKQHNVGAATLRDLVAKITNPKVKDTLRRCAYDIESNEQAEGQCAKQDACYEKLDSGIFKIRAQAIGERILQQPRTERPKYERLVVENGSVDSPAFEIKQHKLGEDPSVVETKTASTVRLTNGMSSSELLEDSYSKVQYLATSPGQESMTSSTAFSSVDSCRGEPGVGSPRNAPAWSPGEDTTASSNATQSAGEPQAETTETTGSDQRPTSDTSTITSRAAMVTSEVPRDLVTEPEVEVPNAATPSVNVGDQGLPNRFFTVKERISSTVMSTTRFVIQSIKEKTHLTRVVSSPDDNSDCKPAQITKDSSFSRINTKNLIQATEVCRTSMDDPRTLCDPVAIQRSLTTWAEELNHNLKALHSSIIISKQTEKHNKHINQYKDLPEAQRMQNDEQPGKENSDDPSQNNKLSEKETFDESSHSNDQYLLGSPLFNNCGEAIEADQAGSERIHQLPEAECDVLDGVKPLCDSSRDERCQNILDVDTVNENCLIDILSVSAEVELNKEADLDHVSHFGGVRYTVDPFNLPPGAYEDASQLAQLCISFGCYGSISDIVYPPITSKYCDLKHVCNVSNNTISENTCDATLPSMPSIEEGNLYNNLLDEQTIFLRCHFHFLCHHLDQLHDVIIRGTGEQRFEQWKTFVACLLDLTEDDVVTQHIMDQEVNTAIDTLRSQAAQRGIAALAFIVRLYGIVPRRTLAFCAEISNHILPIDVYLLTRMGSKVNEHFLMYACSMLDMEVSQLEWELTMGTFCDDAELCHALLACLLQPDPHLTTPLSCSCGLPWPGAHLHPWPNEVLLQRVLGQSSACVTEVKDMCRAQGYWKGVIGLFHREENWDADHDLLQEIILQLGDVRLLIKDSITGYYPESVAEWEKVLSRRSKQRYGRLKETYAEDPVLCLGCSRPLLIQTGNDSSHSEHPSAPHPRHSPGLSKINDLPEADQECTQLLADGPRSRNDVTSCWRPDVTWERLAAMLVLEVGLHRALEMLQRVDIPHGALSMSFFTNCVMAAATLQSYQTDLPHTMVEHVGTAADLWPVKPVTMAPQITMAVPREKRDATPTQQTLKMFKPLRGSRPVSKTRENVATSWGVCVDLSAPCCACVLPLQARVCPLQTGAIFYKCGHGFHCACSSAISCEACSSRLPVP